MRDGWRTVRLWLSRRVDRAGLRVLAVAFAAVGWSLAYLAALARILVLSVLAWGVGAGMWWLVHGLRL